MKKASVAIALAAALLLSCAGSIALYMLYQRELRLNEELTEELKKLAEKESRTAVMQSVNAQMEEIATQERRVSDLQREEAIQQRHVAEEERQNAERQRREAEEQRQNALLAERKAVEASDVAQRQRTIAEQQRANAELAKRVTDTLSYIALARNLGAQASRQKIAGNDPLANLLAYAAYLFTDRYNADVYNPIIYHALSVTSASNRKWAVGHGAVMKIWSLPNSDDFITVSQYGEIVRHTKTADGNLRSVPVFQDSNYDFRDLIIDKQGVIYALSHTGHLFYGKADSKLHVMLIDGATKPFRLFMHREGQLIVVAEQSVHLIDMSTMRKVRELKLNFQTSIAGEKNNQLLLFDKMGREYAVDDQVTTVKAQKLPFTPQPIMSYTYNQRNSYEAYGTVEGTIIIVDGSGKVQRLVGHSSRVSRVKFDGDRLYSTSYDGTVRYWSYLQPRIEPITVIDSRQWIVSSVFDDTMKYIWTGDQNGNLTETLIDAHLMAERVHDRLQREFTREEWDYYVGKEIPFMKMMK